MDIPQQRVSLKASLGSNIRGRARYVPAAVASASGASVYNSTWALRAARTSFRVVARERGAKTLVLGRVESAYEWKKLAKGLRYFA